jgi:hypothetical protein
LILHQIGVPAYVHRDRINYTYISVELEPDDIHWFEVRRGQPFTRRLTFEQLQARYGTHLNIEGPFSPLLHVSILRSVLYDMEDYVERSLERTPSTSLQVRLAHAKRMRVPVNRNYFNDDFMFDSDWHGKLEPLTLISNVFQDGGLF